MQTKEEVLDHYTEILRAFLEKLPVASIAWGVVAGVDWTLSYLLQFQAIEAIVTRSMMFITIGVAVLFDTYFGIRSAHRRGHDITVGKAFWGIARKMGEYAVFMTIAIWTSLAVDGEPYLGEITRFVRGVVFLAIIFVEAESAVGHAGMKIQRVFRYTIEQVIRRYAGTTTIKDDPDKQHPGG
jgi:hypothetical protein